MAGCEVSRPCIRDRGHYRSAPKVACRDDTGHMATESLDATERPFPRRAARCRTGACRAGVRARNLDRRCRLLVDRPGPRRLELDVREVEFLSGEISEAAILEQKQHVLLLGHQSGEAVGPCRHDLDRPHGREPDFRRLLPRALSASSAGIRIESISNSGGCVGTGRRGKESMTRQWQSL